MGFLFVVIVVIVVVVIVVVNKNKKKKAIQYLEMCDNGAIVDVIKTALEEEGYTVSEPQYSLSMHGLGEGIRFVNQDGKCIGSIYYDAHVDSSRSNTISVMAMRLCAFTNADIQYKGKARYYAVEFHDNNILLRSSIPTEGVPRWLDIAGTVLAAELIESNIPLKTPDWYTEYTDKGYDLFYVNTKFPK